MSGTGVEILQYPERKTSTDISKLPVIKTLDELLEIAKENKNPSKIIITSKESTKLLKTEDANDTKVNMSKSEPDIDKLIGHYLQLLGEKQKLSEQNSSLQIKVLDRLKEKKKESFTEDDDDNSSILPLKVNDNKNVEKKRKKFIGELSAFATLKHEVQLENENIHKMLSKKTLECQGQRDRVQEKKQKLRELQFSTALKVDGKLKSEMEKVLESEDKKDEEIETLRLRNIRLGIQIEKLQGVLKPKNAISGTANALDFEQLKLENQANNERLEERNEEVMKLKNKISSSLQVLMHVREKLNFFQKTMSVEKENLANAERSLSQMRDELCHMKHARDCLRDSNQKLKASVGIIDKEILLRDFEDCADNHDRVRSTLEQLKNYYHTIKTKSLS